MLQARVLQCMRQTSNATKLVLQCIKKVSSITGACVSTR